MTLKHPHGMFFRAARHGNGTFAHPYTPRKVSMASNKDKHVQPESSVKRHKGNSFVYIGTVVLLIITVIAFVFVPASGSVATGDELTFGSWDGKPIAFVQGGYFSTQVQQIKAQLESQGYSDTGDQFFAYQVWRQAFENTAVHLALLDKAQDAGISISSNQLDLLMIQNESFLENGTFSKRKYREASNTFKLALRKEIENSALKNRYVSDMVSVLASKAELDFLSDLAKAQRIVEYVAFPFTLYPDSERIAYAKANPTAFRRVRLSSVTLSSSEKEAGQILAKVKDGSLSFEEAAKNHSKDAYASKGGDMGSSFVWKLAGTLKNASDMDAVLALAKGEISPVYETITGSWAFYRVEEAIVEPDFAAVDLLASVTEYLDRNEKGRIEDWIVAQADTFLASANTKGFEPAAIAGGLVVKETTAFPLNYGKALDIGYFSLLGSLDTSNLAELQGAETNKAFLEAVFSLPAGQVSKPLIMNDHAIIAKVKEVKTADEGDIGMLTTYYPSVVQQNISNELGANILADERLKDDFLIAFTSVYATTN